MADETVWKFGAFRLDVADRRLWHEQQTVRLTPLAFSLLAHLAKNPHRLLSKDELLRAIEKPMSPDEILYGLMRELRQALGDTQHKPQFIETVHREGYRFIAPVTPMSGAESTPIASPQPPTPSPLPDTWQVPPGFVGRGAEFTILHKLLEKALVGERQLVFLTGEPGIGKTTVARAFLKQVVADSLAFVARGQCIEHYGTGEAYRPVLEAIVRMHRSPGGELVPQWLRQHAPTWLLQFPSFVTPAEYETLQRHLQGATRERMLRELPEVLEQVTPQYPLVLLLEDLHWSDYSTLDLLSTLARRSEPARLLIIGTYRPGEGLTEGHPLRALTQELRGHGQGHEVALTKFGLTEIEQYIDTRFPNNLFPTRLGEVLYNRTAGNPLFLTNLVHDLETRELLVQEAGNWVLLSSLDEIEAQIPENSRHLVERQMERLSAAVQQILEAASITGVEFSTVLVAGTLNLNPETIEQHCETLTQHKQFLRRVGVSEWPDGTQTSRYGFLHAFYQQVWHERVPQHRRQRLHLTIGERLEQAYGPRTQEIAAEVAVHFEEGRDYKRAIQYRQQAAINALQRSAYQETIVHLMEGLAQIQYLSTVDERRQRELSLHAVLGPTLIATRGWTDSTTEKTYRRTQELCQELGETPYLFPSLFGLWGFYTTRAEHRAAYDVSVELQPLAQHMQDSSLLIEASWAAGCSSYYLGNLITAREYLEQGIALYDVQQHRKLAFIYGQDPAVSCLCYLALTLWKLGYRDQALRRSNEALLLARELAYPFTLDWVRTNLCLFHLLRRAWSTVVDLAQEGLAHSVKYGVPLLSAAFTVSQSLAQTMRSRRKEDIERNIGECLASYPALGIDLNLPWNRTMIAENYGRIKRPDEGLAILTEGFTVMERTQERHHEAEMWKVKGELLQQKARDTKTKVKPTRSAHSDRSNIELQQGAALEAEACFLKALDIAQKQSAKSFELRAATSLGQLWQGQGKAREAKTLLSKIYDHFREGLEDEDLKQAKTLLDQLG
jgi:DNA-binding winged helix-turn-helix (wHTH) protein/predicted ATPase